MVLLEGASVFAYTRGNLDATIGAIDEFLREGEEAPAAVELPEGMAVLLFADIA